ncbi:MAG: aminotransferase class I/II-fold pyridoxal phosphate-dependent enzyme [Alphaproteobacteria bacterium]
MDEAELYGDRIETIHWNGNGTARAGEIPNQGLLARVSRFGRTIGRATADTGNPLAVVVEDMLGPLEALINGRRTLMFGTNSYLGLNHHPACISAANAAAQHFGTGSTASRVASGNHRLHMNLEESLARFFGRRQAIAYSTGFMANLGIISGLCAEGDAIFIDDHSHASIYDACRLSGASVSRFRHNDAADLDRLFRASPVPGDRIMVVVEGLYSVWGDLGDLPAILKVAKRHGAITAVDEAHSLGIYGARGRGAAELMGVEDLCDLIIGTFSKSLGGIGGFCVTNAPELDALRYASRPYLYTASLPPPVVASTIKALELIDAEPERRQKLLASAKVFHAKLSEVGFQLTSPGGPVGGVKLHGIKRGNQFWRRLLDEGVYVNLLVPPATPNREVIARYSLSSLHEPWMLDKAIECFVAAGKATDVL